MKKIEEILFPIHTHAEIVYDQNPDQIVYREKDVIAAIKEAMVMVLDEVMEDIDRYIVYNDGFGILVDDNEVDKLRKQIKEQ